VKTTTDFDSFADSYDRALGEALAASGEDRQYFARGRVKRLAECVRRIGRTSRSLLDYGCGTGATTPLLLETLAAETAIGVDTSLRSLDVARRNHSSDQIGCCTVGEYRPSEAVDLAYCNGVFHHIPLDKRAMAVRFVFDSLHPGGLFSFWENNPWNPGTRHVMARCVFDRDAIPLPPAEAKRLLRSQGFSIIVTDFHFVFPRPLSAFRPFEKLLSRLPLGAQYHHLCEKPMPSL
jgi:SAM-dependent methyltransferase